MSFAFRICDTPPAPLVIPRLTPLRTAWHGLVGCSLALAFASALNAGGLGARGLLPNLAGQMDRPLRYHPDHDDFVIHNGGQWFNRPLYGCNTAFRVDTGDEPEFSLYLPGRGGNLRLGLMMPGGEFWLFQARDITARYRPGMMVYEIRDPRLGSGTLRLDAIPTAETEGLVLRISGDGLPVGTTLVWAFGGANGVRGVRDGDIGTERIPIGRYFQLTPENCRGNRATIQGNTFTLHGKTAVIYGVAPHDAVLSVADARQWSSIEGLLASVGSASHELPVVFGRAPVPLHGARFLSFQRLPEPGQGTTSTDLPIYREVTQQRAANNPPQALPPLAPPFTAAELPAVFARADAHFHDLRNQVEVDTPDPYLNAAVGALNVAAGALWDRHQGVMMHGAVAWRTALLGWRGPYALDALGWHTRARRHFTTWAGRQNTDPIPSHVPPPDETANLSRSEAALHSNGDLSHSHYDMNLVYVDEVLRHLDWTGDTVFARKVWPVIRRHLAWERRLFRRPFGPAGAPLYEAYADIWASDDLEYDGGGVTYASAYNAYEEHRASGLAPLAGADPAPYRAECAAIEAAMRRYLWLPRRGWFAEFRDSLGLQLVHPAAGLWTFYHTMDAGIPTTFEAWQMTRYVDTQLAHLPVRGPSVPADQPYAMLATTNWMPYSWSVNNVVVGETAHTALGYWQADRPDEAYRLLKGTLLATMYLGICPGNVGTMTYLDVYRRESQRDFADGAGVLSRAIVQGLFGVEPDLLDGELRLKPGFPSTWTHARMVHPDLSFAYRQNGDTDTYDVDLRFSKPVSLTLELPARRDTVAGVLVDGLPAPWRAIPHCVGTPRIEIRAAPAASHTITVTWSGETPETRPPEIDASPGGTAAVSALAGLTGSWRDPQHILVQTPALRGTGPVLEFAATPAPGHRTIFAQVRRGSFTWWVPVSVCIADTKPVPITTDWRRPVSPTTRYDSVDLSHAFNDRVTQIFRNAYRSPRLTAGASLAIPKQGIGAWAGGVLATADIDDSGLREAAAQHDGRFLMPNGLPFTTPGPGTSPNIAFVSQWSNYPASLIVPLAGHARHLYLLMAGSTNWMQSRLDNGEVVVTYADGTHARLPLVNPVNWWPIDQDYFIDDFQFARPEPIPPRVDLKTGRVRLLDPVQFEGLGKSVPGGAATVLDLALDPTKPLQSLTVHAFANEVVIGLMSATLERP